MQYTAIPFMYYSQRTDCREQIKGFQRGIWGKERGSMTMKMTASLWSWKISVFRLKEVANMFYKFS